MGKFIENAPTIKEVKTEIKEREGGYKDLFLTIKIDGARKARKYIIHRDDQHEIEDIEKRINNRLESEDLQISEYIERDYLFIKVGDKAEQVTGKKL